MEEAMTLTGRLLKVQAALKAPKDKSNDFGHYKYRTAEGILAAAKPLLASNGLVLVVSDDIVAVGDRVYVKATVTVTDGKDSVQTQAFAREEKEKKGMDASQVTGAASSYARKYALNGMFAIDDTKDADALNTSPQYTQPVVPQDVADAADMVKSDIIIAPDVAAVKKIWQEHARAFAAYPALHAEIKALVIKRGKELAA